MRKNINRIHIIKMAVPFSGTFRRSGGVVSAIAKQLRLVNLKAVHRINVKFDPFHENVTHTRNFLYYISSPKLSTKFPNYTIKTEIVCDRQDPVVTVNILPDIAEQSGTKKVTLKSNNLTCLEILQLLNKHITPLAPKEQPVSTISTKSEKKSFGRR